MRKQIELTCFNCGKHFQRAVSTRKQAMQRGKSTPFCSKECSEVLQNTKITLKCSYCGKRIKRPNAEVLKSKTRRFFCSSKCSASVTLNGGELKLDYRKIAFKFKEKKCQECGYENEHALEVHHIDKDRKNNSKENLHIVCANCHTLIHKNKLKLSA